MLKVFDGIKFISPKAKKLVIAGAATLIIALLSMAVRQYVVAVVMVLVSILMMVFGFAIESGEEGKRVPVRIGDRCVIRTTPEIAEITSAVSPAFGANGPAPMEGMDLSILKGEEPVARCFCAEGVLETASGEKIPVPVIADLQVAGAFSDEEYGRWLLSFMIDRSARKGYPLILLKGLPEDYERQGFTAAEKLGLTVSGEGAKLLMGQFLTKNPDGKPVGTVTIPDGCVCLSALPVPDLKRKADEHEEKEAALPEGERAEAASLPEVSTEPAKDEKDARTV